MLLGMISRVEYTTQCSVTALAIRANRASQLLSDPRSRSSVLDRARSNTGDGPRVYEAMVLYH